MAEQTTETDVLTEDDRRALRGAVLTSLLTSEWSADSGKIRAVLMVDLYAEVERIVAHWKGHAEEAGAGFSQVCRDAARIAARNTVLRAQVEHARTWIANCVDPLEVGPETKQQMLDALVCSPAQAGERS